MERNKSYILPAIRNSDYRRHGLMGDVADDMQDLAQRWADGAEYCEDHQRWYLDWCDLCYDGEPPVPKENNGHD